MLGPQIGWSLPESLPESVLGLRFTHRVHKETSKLICGVPDWLGLYSVTFFTLMLLTHIRNFQWTISSSSFFPYYFCAYESFLCLICVISLFLVLYFNNTTFSSHRTKCFIKFCHFIDSVQSSTELLKLVYLHYDWKSCVTFLTNQ